MAAFIIASTRSDATKDQTAPEDTYKDLKRTLPSQFAAKSLQFKFHCCFCCRSLQSQHTRFLSRQNHLARFRCPSQSPRFVTQAEKTQMFGYLFWLKLAHREQFWTAPKLPALSLDFDFACELRLAAYQTTSKLCHNSKLSMTPAVSCNRIGSPSYRSTKDSSVKISTFALLIWLLSSGARLNICVRSWDK